MARILVVDDDADIRFVARLALKRGNPVLLRAGIQFGLSAQFVPAIARAAQTRCRAKGDIGDVVVKAKGP